MEWFLSENLFEVKGPKGENNKKRKIAETTGKSKKKKLNQDEMEEYPQLVQDKQQASIGNLASNQIIPQLSGSAQVVVQYNTKLVDENEKLELKNVILMLKQEILTLKNEKLEQKLDFKKQYAILQEKNEQTERLHSQSKQKISELENQLAQNNQQGNQGTEEVVTNLLTISTDRMETKKLNDDQCSFDDELNTDNSYIFSSETFWEKMDELF